MFWTRAPDVMHLCVILAILDGGNCWAVIDYSLEKATTTIAACTEMLSCYWHHCVAAFSRAKNFSGRALCALLCAYPTTSPRLCIIIDVTRVSFHIFTCKAFIHLFLLPFFWSVSDIYVFRSTVFNEPPARIHQTGRCFKGYFTTLDKPDM